MDSTTMQQNTKKKFYCQKYNIKHKDKQITRYANYSLAGYRRANKPSMLITCDICVFVYLKHHKQINTWLTGWHWWRSGLVITINKVNLHRAGLVLRWVTTDQLANSLSLSNSDWTYMLYMLFLLILPTYLFIWDGVSLRALLFLT